MAFTLPELPYAYEALEPTLDAKTMRIHHTKHHQSYITKLNQALEKAPEFQSKSLEWLLTSLDKLPSEIRTPVKNNAGGHYAHSLFWTVLTPSASKGPTGELEAAIQRDFGGFSGFKEKFTAAAVNHFASGWAWLSLQNGKLIVHSTHDHDAPMTEGKDPIFVMDLWEHAYYLSYQNERPRYVESMWNLVHWDEVGRRYKETLARAK